MDHPHCPVGQRFALKSRRRGEQLEQAIYAAVLDELGRCGYAGLTMEGVATAARTGKATLYRRWQDKDELIIEALRDALPAADCSTDTGNVRDDLIAVLRHIVDLLNSPSGCAIQLVLSGAGRDNHFIRLVHDRVIGPRKTAMEAAIERGIQRGEVRPDAVTQLVLEIGPAAVIHRFLTRGSPLPEGFLDDVVDQVILPLLRPAEENQTRHKSTTARSSDAEGATASSKRSAPPSNPRGTSRSASPSSLSRPTSRSRPGSSIKPSV